MIETKESVQHCACTCGESTFQVKNKPKVRFSCHCTICQSLYKQAFANFTVVPAKDVVLDNAQKIKFSKYRLPPALNRGVCASCGKPTIAFLHIAPLLKLAFIPSNTFSDQASLPATGGHIFYHSRAQDVVDQLPKISGYWRSEWAVSKAIMAGLFK